MKALPRLDRDLWLRERGLVPGNGDDWTYAVGPIDGLIIRLSEKSLDLLYLGNHLGRALDEEDYQGSMFWLHSWGMWSQAVEDAGQSIYRKYLPSGVNIIDKYGLLFDPADGAEQVAVLMLPLIWQWDAYLVPAHGRYFIKTSNDEAVDIFTNSPKEADRLMKALESWGPKRFG